MAPSQENPGGGILDVGAIKRFGLAEKSLFF